MATLILGTSGFWVGYSQNGVTDIPLAVTYSAAMLLSLPWVDEARYAKPAAGGGDVRRSRCWRKGWCHSSLAAPLLVGRHVRDWLRPRVVLPFLAVALPWYGLCYWRNGWSFIHEFFVVAALLASDFGRTDASAPVVVLSADIGRGAAALVAVVWIGGDAPWLG